MSEDSWVWAGRELDRICGVIKKNMDRYDKRILDRNVVDGIPVYR